MGLSLLPGAVGCGQQQTWKLVDKMIDSDFPDVQHISTDSLAALLADTTLPAPLILDVRKPEEYAVSHLPGAVRVDPDATDFSFLDTVDSGRTIVAYCSVGYRSSELAKRMEEAGILNVVNLRGSIFQWANQGLPVYRDGEEVKAVHPYDRVWGVLLNSELRKYEP